MLLIIFTALLNQNTQPLARQLHS